VFWGQCKKSNGGKIKPIRPGRRGGSGDLHPKGGARVGDGSRAYGRSCSCRGAFVWDSSSQVTQNSKNKHRGNIGPFFPGNFKKKGEKKKPLGFRGGILVPWGLAGPIPAKRMGMWGSFFLVKGGGTPILGFAQPQGGARFFNKKTVFTWGPLPGGRDDDWGWRRRLCEFSGKPGKQKKPGSYGGQRISVGTKKAKIGNRSLLVCFFHPRKGANLMGGEAGVGGALVTDGLGESVFSCEKRGVALTKG